MSSNNILLAVNNGSSSACLFGRASKTMFNSACFTFCDRGKQREVKFINDKMLFNIKAFHLKVVDRTENHYKCILREGQFFLVNILSLSGKYILLNELFLTPILFQFPLDLSLVQYLTSLDKLQQRYCDCK